MSRSYFAALCDIADRNGLVVEIVKNDEGTAIWVLKNELPAEFTIKDVSATMRTAVVASPFWDAPFESAAPQLIRMLSERGFE